MVRVFLALWLAAFTIQTTDVLVLVAADACTEDVLGTAGDPCPEGCPRCLCCARVLVSVPQVTDNTSGDDVTRALVLPPLVPSTTASPHKIFHVPKNS